MKYQVLQRLFIPIWATISGALPFSVSAQTVPPHYSDGTLFYLHEQEPPCLWGGWVQQAYLSRQVFDYLVSYDNGKIRPWLAASWSESADRKTITFHLRHDVKFTDGDLFNADAVIANYPAWQKGIGWHGFTYMTGFTKVDDYTVALHLSEPNPEIYNVLANGHYGFQSPDSLAHNSSEQKCLRPVGTGPWKVARWVRGDGISFVRNDDYRWAPPNAHHNGPAYLKHLEWKFVPDATTRWGALVSGGADVIYQPPSAQWQALQHHYQTLSYVATGRPQAFSFNVQRGPFTDQRVRQAFAYALDRKQIVKTVFKGAVPYEGNGSLSKSTPLYLNVDDRYSLNIAKANQLLDAAGWTGRDAAGYRTKDGKTLDARLPFIQAIIDQEGALMLQAAHVRVRQIKKSALVTGFGRRPTSSTSSTTMRLTARSTATTPAFSIIPKWKRKSLMRSVSRMRNGASKSSTCCKSGLTIRRLPSAATTSPTTLPLPTTFAGFGRIRATDC